jgi:deoxyadenosine/deoxycytidine kinase
MRIVIDGNIGSGKTTQLNLLEQKGWKVQREPIDDWPLELFYSDKSRWALLLQLKILQTLRPSEGTVVYERCLLSTRHVFWEYLLRNGLVREEEDDVYRRQYEKDAWYPDVYIFLSKDPDIAFEHIQGRQQTGDSEVSLDYLKDLFVLYKELLLKIECPCHVIDANKSPEEIHSEILSLLSLDGKVHVDDVDKPTMQTTISHRWKMLCTSFSRLCNMHGTSS